MGNEISSMKNVPNDLHDHEYLEMVYDGINYYIQKRSIGDQIGAGFKQSFSSESFALSALGLGGFSQMNKQNTGHFYVTKDNPLNKPLPTTADSTLLSWFIKAFAFEKNIKLENATFEVKKFNSPNKEEPKTTSFGKKRNVKKFNKVDQKLKRLIMDLKKIKSII